MAPLKEGKSNENTNEQPAAPSTNPSQLASSTDSAHATHTPTPSPPINCGPRPSPPINHGPRPSDIGANNIFPTRPPPPSMLPSEPSIPVLEATLVEEPQIVAHVAPQIPIYDAVQVPNVKQQTWLKKNKKIICSLGAGLLIGSALALGLSLGPIASSNAEESNDFQGIVPLLSPESPSPSEPPSLSLTLRPSESPSPSEPPSRPPSVSLPPTSSIAPTPLLYCGEVTIVTDEHPYETTWTLSRIVAVDGVSDVEVVLEGSPEELGHEYVVCLESGEYEFSIFDSFGDGILSPGYYSMTIDGVMIVQGGEFESEETVSFTLPIPSLHPSESSPPSGTPPSPQPSKSSSPSQSLRPTSYPTKSSPPSEIPSSSVHPSDSPSSSEIPSLSSHPSRLPSSSGIPSISIQPTKSSSPSEIPSSSLQPSYLPSSPPSTLWSSLNWNQQGPNTNGEKSYDLLGRSVAFSADGMTIAVGAPGEWYMDDRPGYVKVYHKETKDSSWEQRGEIIYGEANGDEFGLSLTLSGDGNILSIGAPPYDPSGSASGYVKVYKWDEASLNYMQLGETLHGEESDTRFGWSLAISSDGKTLAVATFNQYGQVNRYAWDEVTSNYNRQGQVNPRTADRFGHSLSLSGDGKKLVVGSPHYYSNGDNCGRVTVFLWEEAVSSYQQLGGYIVGDAPTNEFGHSVSFSDDGETLAVGAPFYDSADHNLVGQVKMFRWDKATLNFKQLGQSLYGKAAGDHFGISLALSLDGNALAIGAHQYHYGSGYAEVYGWDGIDLSFKQLGHGFSGNLLDVEFGYPVAISGDGKAVAVGSPGNDENGEVSGQVKIFNLEHGDMHTTV
eukprot:CAMPEP_0201663480 /NCGR_PEP_ID=MMETSP0494-20130426/5262_1 /ASSEMBLY_ACC=CAM_ASM_000839 /TAXON_ID=420259 /ORGANISM="Thalassiosira gravida, Strain GMp14c1" /LENGTH=837 /DNA_ID=CAMNT_0048142083 /DNA_START=198 /DNA_END=2711 /DNA_ORIENTATION=-